MTTRLTAEEVTGGWVRKLLKYREGEAPRIDRIFQYLRDPDVAHPDVAPQDMSRYAITNGPLRWLHPSAPAEVKRLAEISRVNMLKFVINATTQVLYVDGFRAPKADAEEPAWETWQLNRLDARQIGVHRAALSYGASYVVVLPGEKNGEPVPVIRGASPRKLTAVYAEDDDWPELAIEERRSAKKNVAMYRLYDADGYRLVEVADNGKGEATVVQEFRHDLGYVPIVRFISTMDDDGVIEGEVEPLIPIQDQINVTTFGLMVAQHYQAFRQRYVIGWAAETETNALVASAKRLWMFEDPEVKVGEFSQTDLSGYVNSREASLRHLATISQTPAHELMGQLVNLSADALAAAERNHRAKVEERQTTFGESWEQVLELAAELSGQPSDTMAQIRWRDTEARSLSQVADALTKLVAGLGVPAQELWEKIPGVSQTDVERWKRTAESGDAFAQLASALTTQAGPPVAALPAAAPAPAPFS